jgi:hypothetical protein
MRRTLIALATTTSAALAGLLVAAAPAAAATATTATERATNARTMAAASGARFAITVRPARGRVKVAWLTCDPVGGTHRRAAEACEALTAAAGDPAAITAEEDTMCTMEHAPVRATMAGLWQGQPIRYQKTYDNACVMRVATRALFRL